MSAAYTSSDCENEVACTRQGAKCCDYSVNNKITTSCFKYFVSSRDYSHVHVFLDTPHRCGSSNQNTLIYYACLTFGLD